MKVKFCPYQLDISSEKREKINKEIIDVLKNNNLSISEAKIIFQDVLQELVYKPIN